MLVKPKNKFAALFYSILTLFLFFPFIPEGVISEVAMGSAVTIILIAAAYAISDDKKHLYIASSLAGLAVVSAALFYINSSALTLVLSSVIRLVFFLYATWLSLRAIMRDNEVTVDTIYGATCVYFFIGVIWAHIYFILEILHPGAFIGNYQGVQILPDQTSTEFFGDFLYFSYVTLTSLGYGDLAPNFLAAKTFAILETICGQLYLTILVARFVGLHIQRSS